jgi:hypothetical protein
MRRTVKLFIEGQEVDQFQDTQIVLSSSLQNVSDISKVFTDLTQSFTIPASPQNNRIFQHFYENDVNTRNGVSLDYGIRRKAFIEIDTITLRTGLVGIEKANIKDGYPYSYQITFYGDLVTFKDIFGNQKLADLDWSAYDSPYSFTDVVDRVEFGGQDVLYPLISSKRNWQYGNPLLPAENIDTANGAINWTELFPALRVSQVLDNIATNFGITFTGTFLTDNKFTEVWLWFKNKLEQSFITPSVDVDFISAEQFPNWSIGDNDEYSATQGSGNFAYSFNTTNNTISFAYVQYTVLSATVDAGDHKVYADIQVGNQAVQYYIDVYKNGLLFNTLTLLGDQYLEIYTEANAGNPSLFTTLSFKFRSDAPMTFTSQLLYGLYAYFTGLGTVEINAVNVNTSLISTSSNQSLQTCAPDIKVIDFIQGLIKMFNLTIVPITQTTFKLEYLDVYYNQGGIFNITEYTDLASIDVARVKLYKNVTFKYQKSESVTNRAFQSNFVRDYGDLTAPFPYDGQEFKIELPFEDILTTNIDGNGTVVGYALNQNLQTYTPKPVLFYRVPNQPTNIWLTDGVTDRQINTYQCFSADGYYNANYYALNFGAEVSPLYEAVNPNGLYATYWKAYVENLFNRKNRQTTVKTKLPLSILTGIDLNDRVVIRDKRYLINDMKINLSSGETTFVLLNDFRKIAADENGGGIVVPPNAQCVQYLVTLYKGICQADLSFFPTTPPGWTITPSTLTETKNVEICVTANIEADYLEQEPQRFRPTPPIGFVVNELITEDGDFLITEDGQVVSTQLQIIRTNCFTGAQTVEYIDINQLFI